MIRARTRTPVARLAPSFMRPRPLLAPPSQHGTWYLPGVTAPTAEMAFAPTTRRSAAPAPSSAPLRWVPDLLPIALPASPFDQLTPSARCLGGFGCRRQSRPGRHGRDRAAWPAAARSDRPRRAASRHRRRATETRCSPFGDYLCRRIRLTPDRRHRATGDREQWPRGAAQLPAAFLQRTRHWWVGHRAWTRERT